MDRKWGRKRRFWRDRKKERRGLSGNERESHHQRREGERKGDLSCRQRRQREREREVT